MEWLGATEDWEPLADAEPPDLCGDDQWVIGQETNVKFENLYDLFTYLKAHKHDKMITIHHYCAGQPV